MPIGGDDAAGKDATSCGDKPIIVKVFKRVSVDVRGQMVTFISSAGRVT